FRVERNIDCPSRRSRTLSLRSVSGQRVNSGVEEVRILKVSLVAWLLVWNWLQSCRQRLVPLRGERRDIGVHSVHLFDGHIAGEWNRIEPGTAYGRVSKQGVNVVSRLGPPLRHQLVFHDRHHQSGIANLFYRYRLDCGGDDTGRGERSARTNWLFRIDGACHGRQ